MNTENDILIQKYFEGLLSKSDSDKLLRHVNSDPDLQSEFSLYKDLYEHIEHREGIINSIDVIEKINSKRRTNKKPKASSLIIVCLLLIITIISGYFFLNPKLQSTEDLYAEYFIVENISTATKSEPDLDSILDGLKAYNSEDFKSCIRLLEPKINSLDNHSKLALALSYMKTEQSSEAFEILNQLEDVSSFSNAAKWYKALLFLKDGNEEQSKALLSSIPSTSSYSKNAGLLLQNLLSK